MKCAFLGYPSGQKGYKLLDSNTKRTFASRNVVFHEHIFPYATNTTNLSSLPIFSSTYSFVDDLNFTPNPAVLLPSPDDLHYSPMNNVSPIDTSASFSPSISSVLPDPITSTDIVSISPPLSKPTKHRTLPSKF